MGKIYTPVFIHNRPPYIITCLITGFLYRYLCISYANYRSLIIIISIICGLNFPRLYFHFIFTNSASSHHSPDFREEARHSRIFHRRVFHRFIFAAITVGLFAAKFSPKYFLFLLVFRYHSLLVGRIFWVTINLDKENVKKKQKKIVYYIFGKKTLKYF